MNKGLKIFILAGEKSGDELGGDLLKSLTLKYKNLTVLGVGGPKMLEQGLKPIFDMNLIALMGIFELFIKIPKILKLLKFSEKKIIEFNPDILITIDAPGFNLRLQNKIKHLNIKQVHYVAPSVWAWKSYRAKKIAKYLDLLLVLFPFEKEYFTKYNLKTVFIGHPLTKYENYNSSLFKSDKSLLSKSIKKIALLPGSRKSEIYKLLPIFIKSAQLLKKKHKNIKFYILTLEDYKEYILSAFDNKNLDVYITDKVEEKYDIYTNVDFALCTSGTVTMEVAKASTPMLVVYKLNYLTWWIVKLMVKVNTATIINIIIGKNVIPELFQNKVNSQNIYRIIDSYLKDDDLRNNQIKYLKKAISKMSSNYKSPNFTAAEAIYELLDNK
tara:strand:+ start:144 stop:1295 length:1152 start_codon:yes stop_codon:yes gene_type:complete